MNRNELFFEEIEMILHLPTHASHSSYFSEQAQNHIHICTRLHTETHTQTPLPPHPSRLLLRAAMADWRGLIRGR